MKIQKDGNGNPFIEWDQGNGWHKRAWVQTRPKEKDWGGALGGRYLNVVRCNEPGRPGGNPADFPIHNDLPAEQILISFYLAMKGICDPIGAEK